MSDSDGISIISETSPRILRISVDDEYTMWQQPSS